MFQTNNYDVKKKSLIFRKFVLYVDIAVKGDEIIVGQKLNSFFGQIGVFENTEIILNFIGDYFKSIFLNDPVFYENDFDSFDEDLNDIIIFLPLTIIFYFDEKKADFFVHPMWTKNLILKNFKMKFVQNYLIIIKNELSSLFKLNYYLDLLKYSNFFEDFVLNNFTKQKISSYLNKAVFSFFNNEFMYTLFYDEYLNFLYKKRKRILYLKKLKLKNKILLSILNKNLFSWNIKYYLIIVLVKLTFFDNFFNEHEFLNQFVKVYSYFYNFKNNFLKRFRRKKRFKRYLIKNNLGKKFTFYKIFNSIEEKKKKKRK